MKKIIVSILKNKALNEFEEYDVLSVGNDALNESIIGKGTDELKALLKETIIEFINDDNWNPSDEDVDYCIGELAKGHASNIGAEDFWWEEVTVFTKEQENDGVSNEVVEKISWYLQTRHNMFHADMIQRAMFDDKVTMADFIGGATEIVVSERDTDDDEFTPTQFQNDWKEQMQDKMRDYVLHHGENHSDYEQKVVWDHYGCFCRLLIGDRMWDMYRIIPHTDGHVEFDFVDEDGNDLDKNLMNLSVEQIQIIAKALNIK